MICVVCMWTWVGFGKGSRGCVVNECVYICVCGVGVGEGDVLWM